MSLKGGWSETLSATPQIQEIADKVKPQLEEKDKKPYPVFVAITYKTQVVAGTNYLIKVSVSNSTDECVHLEEAFLMRRRGPVLPAMRLAKPKMIH